MVEVGYEELCREVGSLDDLLGHDSDAIFHYDASGICNPPAPTDLSGTMAISKGPKRSHALNHPESWWTSLFRPPGLHVALLHDAVCAGGMLAKEHILLAHGRLIVPDSYFIRGDTKALPADFSSVSDRDKIATVEDPCYFAGMAWDHFGHFVLEGLSRWWLLALLPAGARHELRFVVYNDRPLFPWQLELLEGLGVTEGQLFYLAEPTRFERMLVPSIAYNLHTAVHRVQGDTWGRIGRMFDQGGGPERVYLSRAQYPYHRQLINESQIERLFESLGFTVVYPERMTIAAQIATIRHARVIAGGVGSAMYLSAFALPGVRKLVIAPSNFIFRDDQLISVVCGDELSYVLCAKGENVHPRMADYAVSIPTLKRAVKVWLS